MQANIEQAMQSNTHASEDFWSTKYQNLMQEIENKLNLQLDEGNWRPEWQQIARSWLDHSLYKSSDGYSVTIQTSHRP
ncbi:MAG: hypothetical protein VXY77_00745 [Pseudomonadota bacterium]|nr:hypothetical protein [Pseudomonadota bacterium]